MKILFGVVVITLICGYLHAGMRYQQTCLNGRINMDITEEQRKYLKQYYERRQRFGLDKPTNDGFLQEAGQGISLAWKEALKGVGNTLEKMGFETGTALREYYQRELNANQQLQPHEDYWLNHK